MKLYKKILIFILTVFIASSIIPYRVFALDTYDLQESGYYDKNGNYFNPETGEYFIWNQNNRSTAKTFSFNFKSWIKCFML